MDPTDPPVPELQTMPLGLYDVVQFAILGAGFALFAYFLYTLTSRDEISARYRPSAYAGLCLAAVATVAYLLLYLDWDSGFRLEVPWRGCTSWRRGCAASAFPRRSPIRMPIAAGLRPMPTSILSRS